MYGYFHPDNNHADYNDPQVYERVSIEGSTFGRHILYCKESRRFHPWAVLEKFEKKKKDQPIDIDVYMMYGVGEDLIMMGVGL